MSSDEEELERKLCKQYEQYDVKQDDTQIVEEDKVQENVEVEEETRVDGAQKEQ